MLDLKIILLFKSKNHYLTILNLNINIMVKKNRIKLKINKVQLVSEPEDIQQDFGHLNPTLYLELLENKDKVVKELRNKEYVPPTMPELRKEDKNDNDNEPKRKVDKRDNKGDKETDNERTDNERNDNKPKRKSKGDNKDKERTDNDQTDNEQSDNRRRSPEIVFEEENENNKKDKVKDFISKSAKKDLKEKLRDQEPSINIKKSKYDIDLNDAINRMKPKLSDITSKNKQLLEQLKSNEKDNDRDNRKYRDDDRDRRKSKHKDDDDRDNRKHRDDDRDRSKRRDDRDKDDDHDRSKRHRDDDRDTRREERRKEERRREREERRGVSKLRDGKTVKKSLTALLSSGGKSYKKNKEHYSESEKDEREHTDKEEDKKYVPPKLSEIPSNGSVNVNGKSYRDITNDKPKETELNIRRELQYKFDILRKKYKGAVIPEFTEFSDLNNMQKTYDMTVRKLNLDSSVENYKKYLIGGFMLFEFLLGSLLKFDMGGFSQQQMLSINNYETLLIELGEKSYIKGGSQFPVELRLLFMIVINAGLFIIGKKLTKSIDGKSGGGLGGLFNPSVNNTNNTQPPTGNTNSRKMRGPSNMFQNLDEEKPKAD